MPNTRRMQMATAGAGGEGVQQIWSFGKNDANQIGDGTTTKRLVPTQESTAHDEWLTIQSDDYATMAIRQDGTLWGWGNGYAGALGTGSTANNQPVTQVGSLTNWLKLGGGARSGSPVMAAVKTDGTLWTWGYGGQGGNCHGSHPTGGTKSSPTKVGNDTNWAIPGIGGNRHLGCIKTDGTLWMWGYSAQGQGMRGTTSSVSSPEKIGNDTNWASLACGRNHTAALKTDNTLWLCGRNNHGQLGNNSTTNISSPVQIGGAERAYVSGGFWTTAAVKTNGTLWTRGLNNNGQLGLGNTTSKSVPVQVGVLTDWAQVSACSENMIGVKTDGTMWGWGDAIHGKTGLGNETDTSSPVKIGVETHWAKAATGRSHSIAITK